MGYSAFVVCNCFQEGKTPEPPYKMFLKTDGEELYLDLDITYSEDEDEYLKRHQEFDQWKATACIHKDMRYAKEHLTNIDGMGAFRIVLHESGGEKRFTTLSNYLAAENVGSLPSYYAGQALIELKDLEGENNTERIVRLRLKSGEIKQTTNEKYGHIFIWTGYNKKNYGIDGDGFFIIENRKFLWNSNSKAVFRSKNFKQIVLGNKKFKFVDNDTNFQYIAKEKIHPYGEEQPNQDFEFFVSKETALIADEYKYIIEPLKRLAIASIETGNPIIWT